MCCFCVPMDQFCKGGAGGGYAAYLCNVSGCEFCLCVLFLCSYPSVLQWWGGGEGARGRGWGGGERGDIPV